MYMSIKGFFFYFFVWLASTRKKVSNESYDQRRQFSLNIYVTFEMEFAYQKSLPSCSTECYFTDIAKNVYTFKVFKCVIGTFFISKRFLLFFLLAYNSRQFFFDIHIFFHILFPPRFLFVQFFCSTTVRSPIRVLRWMLVKEVKKEK